MRKANFKVLFVFVSVVLISVSLPNSINAVETAESIKASYQRYLSKIDIKYINEKVPYLLKTKWDQAGIYAKDTPTKVRVGCWSTAIAQILYYHKLLSKGNVSYQCIEGYKINENLESYKFKWSLFVNKIEENTAKESIDQVTMYSYFTAVVMQKDFGTGRHNIDGDGFIGFKDLLETHFDCAVNIYQYGKNSFVTEKDKIIQIVKTEIDSKRPLAFWFGNQYDWGHAVVIDGYLEKGDLFLVNINQGLGGSGNGVYDLFSPIIPSYEDMYWRAILTINSKS